MNRISGWNPTTQKYDTTHKVEGKSKFYLEYSYYHNMRTRATNPNYRKLYPTYEGCTMSEEWEDFQEFARWCWQQKGFGEDHMCLDKDILFPKNKIYHPDRCVFIPNLVNSFMTFRRSKQSLPTGVSWSEAEGKYKVYCSQLNGKNKTLGRFNCPNEAHEVYKRFKIGMAKLLAEMHEDKLDDRVLAILNDFNIEEYLEVDYENL